MEVQKFTSLNIYYEKSMKNNGLFMRYSVIREHLRNKKEQKTAKNQSNRLRTIFARPTMSS